MTRGRTEEAGEPDAGEPDADVPGAGEPDARESMAPTNTPVDPRWAGIIEVLVRGLDGAVRWEPDSVVLQLPDSAQPGRGGDLEGLGLCLERIGMPVVLEASPGDTRDSSLVAFIRELVESGLMVTVRRPSRHAA